MEELLKKFVGKEIDIAFGSNAIVRGELVDVRDGVAFLDDDQKRSVFVAIKTIAVVWEVKESQTRPGFIV